MRRHYVLLLIIVPFLSKAQDLDDLLDNPNAGTKNGEISLLDDLIEGKDTGFSFKLVPFGEPEKSIDEKLFWRTYKGLVTASTIPDEFSIDGEPIMQASVGQKLVLEGPLPKLNTTRGSATLENREHILNPGRIKIRAPGGELDIDHPALLVGNNPQEEGLRIQLAPVVFESLTEDGEAVPFHPQLICEEKPLLSKTLRFRKVTMWLPVGITYESAFGRFQVGSDGSIRYSEEDSPEGVTFTGKGFLRKYPSRNLAQTKPLYYPEFISFRKGDQTLQIYTALQIAPGKSLPIALHAPSYTTFTDKDFKHGFISRKLRTGKTIIARKGRPTSPELETYVAGKFECPPEEIIWSQLELDSRTGPIRTEFNISGVGTVRRDILVLETGRGLHLLPHRHRSAFMPEEKVPIHLFLGKGFPGGKIVITAKPLDDPKRKKSLLAELKIPANHSKTYDSRLLYLQTRNLLPGRYELIGRMNNQWLTQPFDITITRQAVKSQFVAYVHNWWGNLDRPDFDEKLKILESANIQFLANGPRLQSSMPRANTSLARQLADSFEAKVPAEALSSPTYNDRLLDRLLHHRLSHVDFTLPRRDSIYNEGRSYHHSFKPDIERTIRRLHIFTQQTEDHPNLYGTTLFLDTRWQGVRSGFGTPTDMHVGKRNLALKDVLDKQEIKALPEEEYRFLIANPRSEDPATRSKVDSLRESDLTYWHAEAEQTYVQHNPIYQEALKEIRPGSQALIFEEANLSRFHMPADTFASSPASIYYSNGGQNDMPMLAAFTTDWASGHAPERPVWFTRGSEDTSGSLVKDLLHAFARGLRGGGIDLPYNADTTELKRRAGFMKFLTQYGSIPTQSTPHRPVTILATSAKQRYIRNGTFQYHAAYVLLTRLGYPPAILHENVLQKEDIPPVKLLILINEEHDLRPKTREQIEKLHSSGTHIIAIGQKPRDIPVDAHIPEPLKHIFENPENNGFGLASHHWLWKDFLTRRSEFEALFKKLRTQPRAVVNPEQAYALTLDDGPIRYVAVITDRINSHSSKFVREPKLSVSLEGEWELVRDLRLQQYLPSEIKDGRTLVSVPLETEPCTLLALIPKPKLTFEDYKSPAKLTAYTGSGDILIEEFATTNDRLALDADKVVIQELLTGHAKEYQTKPSIQKEKSSLEIAAGVHIRGTLPSPLPKLVLLEAGREKLAPIARKLAQKLEARFWQLEFDDFDEHPFRWYPKPEDIIRLENIREGRLVGFRKSLNPVLDSDNRHKPSLGGYRSLNPPFMIGENCIVFSGGELGESLRDMSAWMDTPNTPGQGQSRILNLFSPFWSGCNAVVLVAKDLDGFRNASETLVTHSRLSTGIENQTGFAPSEDQLEEITFRTFQDPVPTPFTNYCAHRHTERLLVAENGRTAIVFSEENGTAMIDTNGKTLCAVKPVKYPIRLLSDGSLWSTETYGEENARIMFRKLNIEGKVEREFEIKGCNFRAVGSKTAANITPDGRTAIIGQPGSILFINLQNGRVRAYDDTANLKHRYSAFYPRVPVSTTFSPDGKYLLVTLDSRPPINGLSQPTFTPTFSSTILFDIANPEQPLWVLDDGKSRRATYAAHKGFAAVAKNGTVALAGFDGEVFVIDSKGQFLARHKIDVSTSSGVDREGPADGVGTDISAEGETAAFAYRKQLIIWHADAFKVCKFPAGLVSISIPPKGGRVHISTDSGKVLALTTDGTEIWSLSLKPDAHLANAPKGILLAADGTGTLHRINSEGNILHRHKVWEDSIALTRQRRNVAGLKRDLDSPYYLEPDTLAQAKKYLSASQIAKWEPTGQTKEQAGRIFHHTEGEITLQTGNSSNSFLHLVYRKENEADRLPIEITGETRKQFVLDLPTPAYRIVNLPITGTNQTIRIPLNRSVGITECSLWSYAEPESNLAYQPPLTSLLEPEVRAETNKDNLLDDLLGDDLLDKPDSLQDKDLLNPNQPNTDVEKKLRVWWPNVDPVRTQGRFLTPKVEARLMVDNKRFGTGKDITPPWSNSHAPWGASFTLKFAKPQKVSLLATYDRTMIQSKVSQAIQVFNGTLRNEHDSPPALGTVINNDQFWRLFPITGNRKFKTLGVHAFSGRGPDGLSEIEVFP